MLERRAVIFDCDGTLIDSRADLTTAVNAMRADFELPPLSLATVTGYVGNGIHKLVERALDGAVVDHELAVAVQINTDFGPGVQGLKDLVDEIAAEMLKRAKAKPLK